jgi:curli biogenesis system outer membrane secretion channel CsgG
MLLKCSVLFVFCLGCSSSQYVKGNIYKKDKIDFKHAKFAILKFNSASEGKSFTNRVSTDGNAITDLLTIQMSYKGYEVVEREKVNDILKEVALAQSGTVASDSAKIIDLGKILGVDYIIYGSVVQYENQISKGGTWNLAVGITARVIDIKTSTVVLALSASKEGDSLADALDGITLAFVDALQEEKAYVWQ